MHPTEVKRFAASGAIEQHPMKAAGVAGVLVCPEAKGGGELRTPVGAEARAAAERLLQRGIFGIERCAKAVKAAGIDPPFTPGRFRHSVSTWAINMGTDPAQVSAFLNHKDGRTTRKFYATHAVVTKIPTLI